MLSLTPSRLLGRNMTNFQIIPLNWYPDRSLRVKHPSRARVYRLSWPVRFSFWWSWNLHFYQLRHFSSEVRIPSRDVKGRDIYFFNLRLCPVPHKKIIWLSLSRPSRKIPSLLHPWFRYKFGTPKYVLK